MFVNHIEINVVMTFMNDDKKQFLIEQKKLRISKNKIDDYIKKHHDDSLQNHLKISKTL